MRISKTLLAGLATCFCLMSSARSQINIEVLATIDYPGAGNSTTPRGINSSGLVVGDYVDAAGITRGFVRLRNGTFPDSLLQQQAGGLTAAYGINSTRMICGYFLYSSRIYGFLYDAPSRDFTAVYSGDPEQSYYLFGINDAGYLVGSIEDRDGTRVGIALAGPVTGSIEVAGSTFVEANGINNLNQIVGEYFDPPPATTFHGYFRDAHTHLTFPVDFPGSSSTALVGLNDRRLIVGRWVDNAGMEHGLLLRQPSTFTSFDYPGAAGTSLNGINNDRFIVGHYTDSAGLHHGFLARATR